MRAVRWARLYTWTVLVGCVERSASLRGSKDPILRRSKNLEDAVDEPVSFPSFYAPSQHRENQPSACVCPAPPPATTPGPASRGSSSGLMGGRHLYSSCAAAGGPSPYDGWRPATNGQMSCETNRTAYAFDRAHFEENVAFIFHETRTIGHACAAAGSGFASNIDCGRQ